MYVLHPSVSQLVSQSISHIRSEHSTRLPRIQALSLQQRINVLGKGKSI